MRGENARLSKANCQLKYTNKRLLQQLEQRVAAQKASQQVMQETVADIRQRFRKVRGWITRCHVLTMTTGSGYA